MNLLRIAFLCAAITGLAPAVRADDKPVAPKGEVALPQPAVHCEGRNCLPATEDPVEECKGQDCTLAPAIDQTPGPEIEQVK